MNAPVPGGLKPWWKSTGFWMGAVVAVFLGWVMVDSAQRNTAAIRASASEVEVLQIGEGSLQWMVIKTPSGHGLGSGWTVTRHLLIFDDRKESPGILGVWLWNETLWKDVNEFNTRISIPIWVFLLAWLALWLGGMAWWRGRVVRRVNAATARLTGPPHPTASRPARTSPDRAS